MLSQQKIPEFDFMLKQERIKPAVSVSENGKLEIEEDKNDQNTIVISSPESKISDEASSHRSEVVFWWNNENDDLNQRISIINSMSSEDNDIFDEKESFDERISNMSNSSAINKLKKFPSHDFVMKKNQRNLHKKSPDQFKNRPKRMGYYLDEMAVSESNTSFISEVSQIYDTEYWSSTRTHR